jgi:hypothetical protein
MVEVWWDAAVKLLDLWKRLREASWDFYFDSVRIPNLHAFRSGAEPEVARDRHMAILAWLYGKLRVREKKILQPPRRQRVLCRASPNHRFPMVVEEP